MLHREPREVVSAVGFRLKDKIPGKHTKNLTGGREGGNSLKT